MYRTVSNDFSEEEIKNFDYDMMLFFSPTGVKALKKNFPNFEQGNIAVGAFGPATAKRLKMRAYALIWRLLIKLSIYDRCLGRLSETS